MTERPILFSGPMVRAILDGRKTQTRRLVKPQPPTEHDRLIVETIHPTKVDKDGEEHPGKACYGVTTADGEWCLPCPYGAPGDRLWVRETWRWSQFASMPPGPNYPQFVERRAEQDDATDGYVWRPSIFMPRWACRLELEITRVRFERLQEISAKDILAEGAVTRAHDDQFGHNPVSAFDGKCYMDLKSLWAAGWNSINGKRAPWRSNPYVWVVEFRRAEPMAKAA